MASAVTGPPATLTAGDSWAWSEAVLDDFPPAAWALSIVLRPMAGGSAITIAATAGADAWEFAAGASATAAHAAGDYDWTALATDGAADARCVLGRGRLEVLPDPATAGGDLRSSAERILDAIEATLEGRATKDADSFTIEGRTITRTPIRDLIRLRALYRTQVNAERGRGLFQNRRIRLA